MLILTRVKFFNVDNFLFKERVLFAEIGGSFPSPSLLKFVKQSGSTRAWSKSAAIFFSTPRRRFIKVDFIGVIGGIRRRNGSALGNAVKIVSGENRVAR